MTTSASTQVFYPALRYVDAHAAIGWLERAFGFTRDAVYEGPDGTVAHAQLRFEGALIMMGSSTGEPVTGDDRYPVRSAAQTGVLSGSIYVACSDPDALHARAADAGARIHQAPYDTEYDSREFSAYDCDGHLWSFGTYRP